MPSFQMTLLPAILHALAFVTTSNAAIDLGSAATYGVLGAADVTNTGVTTVDGSVGVYPGTSITGFPPGVATGVYSYGDPVAAAAQADAATAYGAATGLPCGTDLTGQDLGGMVLLPGVYCFATSAPLTGLLILDDNAEIDAQWVFQIGSTLTTATGSAVTLLNGAQPCGITWAVGSSATLGTGTAFAGDVIAMASISVDTDVTSQGGLYALTGGVTLIMDTISISETGCTTGVFPSATSSTLPATTSPSSTISSPLSTSSTVSSTVSITASSTASSTLSSTISSTVSSTVSSTASSSSHSTSASSSSSSSTHHSTTLSTSCTNSSSHSSSSTHSTSCTKSSTHSSSSTHSTSCTKASTHSSSSTHSSTHSSTPSSTTRSSTHSSTHSSTPSLSHHTTTVSSTRSSAPSSTHHTTTTTLKPWDHGWQWRGREHGW